MVKTCLTLLVTVTCIVALSLMSINVPPGHPLDQAYNRVVAKHGLLIDINSNEALLRQSLAVAVFASII